MALAEEIKKALMENPSILIEVLISRPEIIYQALAKLTPWQILATRDDIKKIEERLENIERSMVTKDEAKNFATKDDLRALEKRLVNLITGLGAMWGLMAEESFREGVKEILKDTGFSATKDLLYDKDGKIYGEPSDVEYDLIVKDGKAIMIEITSALKRGDLSIIKKKKEFYELQRSVKIEKIIIITPFIHDKYPDRVRAMANSMNIDIVYPIP